MEDYWLFCFSCWKYFVKFEKFTVNPDNNTFVEICQYNR